MDITKRDVVNAKRKLTKAKESFKYPSGKGFKFSFPIFGCDCLSTALVELIRAAEDPHAHSYVARRIEYYFAHLYRQDYHDHKASSGTSSNNISTSYGSGNPGWFVQSAWVHDAAPHQLFIVTGSVPSTTKRGVLEGELTMIFTAMIEQYKCKDRYLLLQKVMRVMMISVIGHVGRVVHANFDGEHMHRWVSELVDLSSMTEVGGYDSFC
ncbi:hypothetical protein BDW72DRAFT_194810 [Aspergillus terricola var. indicus]